MDNYYIDAVDLYSSYNVRVLKSTGFYESPRLRHTKHVWPDKSGVDIDFNNVYYEEQEITLDCICQATSKLLLITYMETFSQLFASKGLMVLSARNAYRRAKLVYRDDEITGSLHRTSNGGYAFRFSLRLKVSNPNAYVKYINITSLTYTLTYSGPKGWLFWGDGNKVFLTADDDYSHVYSSLGMKEIVVDIDGLTASNVHDYVPGP